MTTDTAVQLKPCKYGDPTCPCQDGDACHYEGENPYSVPPEYVLAKVERLEASNKVLRDACEHVVKWLGHPELEDSDTANAAFKKALKKCRAALNNEDNPNDQ